MARIPATPEQLAGYLKQLGRTNFLDQGLLDHKLGDDYDEVLVMLAGACAHEMLQGELIEKSSASATRHVTVELMYLEHGSPHLVLWGLLAQQNDAELTAMIDKKLQQLWSYADVSQKDMYAQLALEVMGRNFLNTPVLQMSTASQPQAVAMDTTPARTYTPQQQAVLTKKLTIRDLATVKRMIWDARNSWTDFGLNLGVDPGTLQSIGTTCRDNPDNCFREMLSTLLRGGGTVNWQYILKALRETGHLMHVAAEAEQKILPASLNHAVVVRAAWDSRHKYYHLGLELGIDAGELDALNRSYLYKCDDIFPQVIKLWLDKSPEKPVDQLAEALSSPTVGFSMLAETVKSRLGQ